MRCPRCSIQRPVGGRRLNVQLNSDKPAAKVLRPDSRSHSPHSRRAAIRPVGYSWPASHTPTNLSQLPLARRLPSLQKHTLETRAECPFRTRSWWPCSASQILIVPSPLPLANRSPSGLKQTQEISSFCTSGITGGSRFMSQIQIL
jgi:hypothetical protein